MSQIECHCSNCSHWHSKDGKFGACDKCNGSMMQFDNFCQLWNEKK